MATASRRTARRDSYNTPSDNIRYFDGNAARSLDFPARELPDEQYRPRKVSVRTRRNREKAYNMTLGYAFFLVASICFMTFICTQYLTMQSEVTRRAKTITRLEAQLNDMKLANDEEYARIMGAVDLEQIKHVAMDELGMTYPIQSQIVSFTDVDSDYVRQYGDIPE